MLQKNGLFRIIIRRETDPYRIVAENRLFRRVFGYNCIDRVLQQLFSNDNFDFDFIGSHHTAGTAESTRNHFLTASGSFPGAVRVMPQTPRSGIEYSIAYNGSLSGWNIKIQTVILFHKSPPKGCYSAIR